MDWERRVVTPKRLGNLATFVAFVLLAASPAGAVAREGCEPPSGFPEAGAVERVDANSASTVRYEDDSYSVARCRPTGEFDVMQHVAPVPVPGGEIDFVPLEITESIGNGEYRATFKSPGDPDDPKWAADWALARDEVLAERLPPTEPGRVTRFGQNPGGGSGGTPACQDGTFSRFATWAASGYNYYFDWGSVESNAEGVRNAVRDRVVDGHNAWNYTVNDCGFNNQSNFFAHFEGDVVGISSQNNSDNRNMVDFGNVDGVGCAGNIACVHVRFNSLGRIAEVDMRVDDICRPGGCGDIYWGTGTPASDQYDIWSIVAHESGHAVGLNDLYSSNNAQLTMYGYGTLGATRERTLGRGDVLGMRQAYPQATGSATWTLWKNGTL